jgi:molybdopterin converting factor small subunit
MSVKIHIPTVFRPSTAGAEFVEVEAATVEAALAQLCAKHEGLRGRLFREQNRLNRFVNVYLNDEDIRYLSELKTPVRDGDKLSLVPAVAGG